MSSIENPIVKVEFTETDYRDPGGGGGGGKKLFRPITPQFRRTLLESLDSVRDSIAPSLEEFPQIPAVIVMQLREDAVAKSHRPWGLIHESEVELIGNAALGQLLISTTPQTLDALDNVIANRQTKEIKANLSTLTGFEGWSADWALSDDLKNPDRHPQLLEWFNAGKPLIVELFEQPTAILNRQAEQSFVRFLSSLELTFSTQLPGLVGKSFYVSINNINLARRIASHPAVRSVLPVPEIVSTTVVPMTESMGPIPAAMIAAINVDEDLPIVGVFDSGVDPACALMNPWVVSRVPYVLPPETDYLHGTMVASVVSCSRVMNSNDLRMPEKGARILDVAGLEIAGGDARDILDRLIQTLEQYPNVKVWNLSLGSESPAPEDEFSWFAHQLDNVADRFNVLFIVSAGNTRYLHTWPCPTPAHPDHRISSPGDSVRALSVGSLANLHNQHTMVVTEDPSPFTRRGPGPVKTPKPDVVHYGGNCASTFDIHSSGIVVAIPGNEYAHTVGTSFSAPQVSALAANIWQDLEERGFAVNPSLVKALIIHSAAIRSPERDSNSRQFFGAGIPGSPLDMLFCSSDAFTLLFEVEVADRRKWTKTPFPIPECLLTDEGKFRGEAIVTLVYDPPLDATMGAEYVRANVDVSFGQITYDEEGSPSVKGVVPLERSADASTLYETAQIENGYKWSPVKTYRQRFPRGKAIDQWAIQATITRRAAEQPPATRQKAVILVTLRGLDQTLDVYADGIIALGQTNWVTTTLAQNIQVAV